MTVHKFTETLRVLGVKLCSENGEHLFFII